MKRREDLLRDILFLIEKSQRKGSRRLNADKNILYWEIGRLIKQDLYSKETTLHRIDTFKYLSRELVVENLKLDTCFKWSCSAYIFQNLK